MAIIFGIKKLRKELPCSTQEVAESLGYKLSYYYRLERGEVELGQKRLTFLKKSFQELFNKYEIKKTVLYRHLLKLTDDPIDLTLP